MYTVGDGELERVDRRYIDHGEGTITNQEWRRRPLGRVRLLQRLSSRVGWRCRGCTIKRYHRATPTHGAGRNNYVHRVSDPNLAEHAGSSFSCMAVATTATDGL